MEKTNVVVPFRQFIVKVHSRCNLACDYCYMYEAVDQSWREQPRVMSANTIGVLAARIADHVRAHRLNSVNVVLHGGEPLLAGRRVLDSLITTVRSAVDTEVDFSMQTNGILLSNNVLELLERHQVRIGVSVDGGAEHHDRHRRSADGRGSYARVAKGLERLASERYRPLFAGLLGAIDLDNDPVQVYEALAAWEPPTIDLLFPHATWDAPPPGHNPGQTRYADWLIAVFDHWYNQPVQPVRVRLFEELIVQLLGGTAHSEVFGSTPMDFVVVETDGSLELVDSLKVAYEGAPATGLSIHRDSFDSALEHPSIRAGHSGVAALGEVCRSCPLVGTCGGGQHPHRYRTGTGFANPSVYCADLAALISHVRGRIQEDIERLTGEGGER